MGHGWFEPGYIYSAVITDLYDKSKIVYYQYGSYKYGWSKEESFLPVPATGANISIKVAVIADIGVTEYEGANMLTRFAEPEATAIMQNMAGKVLGGSVDRGTTIRLCCMREISHTPAAI